MKSFHFLSLAGAILSSTQSFAGTMGPPEPVKDWRWVGSIAAGPVWARAGSTQTFFLAPEIEKTYVARKSSKALASGELFAGIQKPLSPQWQAQLGLAVAATGSVPLQGVIWDDADPQFDNHRYSYKIGHSRVAVKGKLLFESETFMLTPWVSGSLGAGFNRARRFNNWPVIFEALPNANFTDNRKTAFSYTLGVGAQKAIDEHWQIGAGYEFADWGKSELGRAPGQTLNSGLKLNHLYTNGVLFNLTYIA